MHEDPVSYLGQFAALLYPTVTLSQLLRYVWPTVSQDIKLADIVIL